MEPCHPATIRANLIHFPVDLFVDTPVGTLVIPCAKTRCSEVTTNVSAQNSVDNLESLARAHRAPAVLVTGWNAGLQQIMEEINTELDQLTVPEVHTTKNRDQE